MSERAIDDHDAGSCDGGVVHCKLSVEVECGEVAGELVVVELEVDTVPGGFDGDCEQVVGCEVGSEGWRVCVGRRGPGQTPATSPRVGR